MKKAFIVVILLLTFINVNFAYTGEPERQPWNNVRHDSEKHVFHDLGMMAESWWIVSRNSEESKRAAEIPEKKKVVVTFRSFLGRIEDSYHYAILGLISGQKRIKPFFIHSSQDPEYSERLDTVMMPSGSIAALNSINDRLRKKYDFLEPSLAIDESYPAADAHGREREYILRFLQREIEGIISARNEPVVFCSLLSYNAEKTLELLRSLKKDFGRNIRTGIGGQLVRISPRTYESMDFIDHVGVGDAEAILEPLLIGKKPFAEKYLPIGPENHYADFSYANYLAIHERLDEMSRYQFGPFSNMRQLSIESVRGCSWANSIGKACAMCSLQSITDTPIFKPFERYFAKENELAEKFGANWIFDVSNQFIPVMGEKKQERWLKEYLAAKKKFSRHEVNKYAYLTANSISENTAPLLREAGVRLPYIGFDGWDAATRKALGKPQVDPWKVLELCRKNGLRVRLGIVIGSGLSPENIRKLPLFAKSLIREFGGTILTWGSFLEIILPGSQVWYAFEKEARTHDWQEASGLYDYFYTNGYLTWPQQEKMTELFIRLSQKADYDEVLSARNQMIANVQPYAIPITFRDGGKLEII